MHLNDGQEIIYTQFRTVNGLQKRREINRVTKKKERMKTARIRFCLALYRKQSARFLLSSFYFFFLPCIFALFIVQYQFPWQSERDQIYVSECV